MLHVLLIQTLMLLCNFARAIGLTRSDSMASRIDAVIKVTAWNEGGNLWRLAEHLCMIKR